MEHDDAEIVCLKINQCVDHSPIFFRKLNTDRNILYLYQNKNSILPPFEKRTNFFFLYKFYFKNQFVIELPKLLKCLHKFDVDALFQ